MRGPKNRRTSTRLARGPHSLFGTAASYARKISVTSRTAPRMFSIVTHGPFSRSAEYRGPWVLALVLGTSRYRGS